MRSRTIIFTSASQKSAASRLQPGSPPVLLGQPGVSRPSGRHRIRAAPVFPFEDTLPVARARRTGLRNYWGWLPTLSLTGAIGLLVIGAANRLTGSGFTGLEPVFWIGLLLIVVPIAARLLASRVSRAERLGLVLVLGLFLYLVKVLQSPFAFTYSDEFIHAYNTNRIFESGRLFSPNPILPVSALYPGLELATTAVMRLTGLDVFGAGLIIVGMARLVMMLALFLLYEQLGGSTRTASLAAMLYTAHSNFLFWSAQFSYESLALPLVVLVLYLAARREAGEHRNERLGLTLAAIAVIGAVVVTHHLSSYFLAGMLVLWTITGVVIHWWRRFWNLLNRRSPAFKRYAWAEVAAGAPSGLAIFAMIAATVWLVIVANLTLRYLYPMFDKAVVSLFNQILGEAPGRGLFHSTSGMVSPLWERVVGFSAVFLCLLGLPFGLRQVWRRCRRHPLALMFAGAAIAYFGLLGLRFVPSAWEISNRSSEFLFLGLAFVLASSRLPRWLSTSWLAAMIGIIFAGGVVAGWPSDLRLAQVYQVTVSNRRLEPAGLEAARWAREYLGPGQNFAADDSNGRFLLTYGDQQGLTGRNLNIKSLFETDSLGDWQIDKLYDAQIEFVAFDRRLVSADNMLGYFFSRAHSWPLPANQLVSPESYSKFDNLPGVSRIFDSGELVLYDIRKWIYDAPQP